MLSLILAGLSGYLFGSIPTAFLVVQWKAQTDIRRSGSGNVGTLNSFVVTGSKAVGAIVLLIDVGKGVAALLLARALMADTFVVLGASAIGAVLGHNYPVWLRFKGGRGLATAAGAMLVAAPLIVPLWGLFWLGSFLPIRRVNVANAIASLAVLILLLASPEGTLRALIHGTPAVVQVRIFAPIFFGAILAKHVGPLQEFLGEKRKSENG